MPGSAPSETPVITYSCIYTHKYLSLFSDFPLLFSKREGTANEGDIWDTLFSSLKNVFSGKFYVYFMGVRFKLRGF
jgi:hypothetical protein